MKGQVQIITVLLAVFAVSALFIALIATDVSFDTALVSSQQEDIDSYQSRLYLHTLVQNRTFIDKAGNYSVTGGAEARNSTRKGLENIIGENGSIQAYRVSLRETESASGGNGLSFSNGDAVNLGYSRILVPSPKTNQYELELGSKIQ